MFVRRAMWLVLVVLLAGCAAEPPPDRPPRGEGESPPTPAFAATLTPPAPPATVPPLIADTGNYANMVELLDAVCYEFLLTVAGEALLWTDEDGLAAFFDRVDESELCAGTVTRPAVDFSAHALAGTIISAVGCDAAHRVLGLERNDSARRLTLDLALDIRLGCPYELLEPVLIAIPPPPADFSLETRVDAPADDGAAAGRAPASDI
jgi:hypothetical protein